MPTGLRAQIEIEIQIEIVYNMYRMRRFTTITVCAGCCQEAYKLGLDKPLQGYSRVLLRPGECAMRGDGGVQLGACEGAVCGGAARARAGFDAVYR